MIASSVTPKDVNDALVLSQETTYDIMFPLSFNRLTGKEGITAK